MIQFLAGHFGVQKTYELISRTFYWPRMKTEVEIYVDSCLGMPKEQIIDHHRTSRIAQALGNSGTTLGSSI